MYNKTFNYLFQFYTKLDKIKAIKASETTISTEGIKSSLLLRLRENERFRNEIFSGKFKQEFHQDRLTAAEERILSNFKAGLM